MHITNKKLPEEKGTLTMRLRVQRVKRDSEGLNEPLVDTRILPQSCVMCDINQCGNVYNPGTWEAVRSTRISKWVLDSLHPTVKQSKTKQIFSSSVSVGGLSAEAQLLPWWWRMLTALIWFCILKASRFLCCFTQLNFSCLASDSFHASESHGMADSLFWSNLSTLESPPCVIVSNPCDILPA